MVSQFQSSGATRLVLTPNRSLTWRGNKYLLLSLLLLLSLVSLGFAISGAWLVFPFVLLEMIFLFSAFYYVSWKLSFREVVEFNERTITIEKGVYVPKKCWRISREKLRVSVVNPTHEWDAPRLTVINEDQKVHIGEFLNKSETLQLLAMLRSLGIRQVTEHPCGISV